MNIVVNDPNVGQMTYNIEAFHKEVISFGRKPDNDIVLNHDFVSRVHGAIYREGNDYYIEDMDSTNGMFVNGNRVKKARLKNGDCIILARTLNDRNCVRFFINNMAQPQPTYVQPQPTYVQPQPAYVQPQSVYVQPQPAYMQPQQYSYYQNAYSDRQGINVNVYNQLPPSYSVARMKTDRSMLMYVLLTILTLGIYAIYFFSVLGNDVNLICSRRDGKMQMHFLIATWLLGIITLGIVPLVWHTTLSERIGAEARSRGIQTTFGGGSFWLWEILGLLIIIGPFVYIYKLCKVMNMICMDYNQKGY